MTKARDLADYTGLQADLAGLQTNITAGDTAARAGRKNILINGGFDVWQRGTSASGISGYTSYSADRWKPESGGSSMSMSYSSLSDGIEVSRVGSGTGPINLTQRIEASSVKTSVGLEVTFSGYVKTTDGLDVIITAYTPASNATDSWGSRTHQNDTAESSQSFNMSGADTWTYISYTFTVPNDAIYGLAISINAAGDAANNIKLSAKNTQLELGSVATDFEHKSYGESLADCQRYFYTRAGTGYAHVIATGQGFRMLNNDYPVRMRTAPTITYGSVGGTWTGNPDAVSTGERNSSVSGFGLQGISTASGEIYSDTKVIAEAEL